jgi:short-subunit dehydrogenase
MQNKDRVLITGGSSGFGLELAHRFGATGHDLLLVALPGEELEEAAHLVRTQYPSVEVHHFGVDLSLADGPKRVSDFVRAHSLRIDVLINNAGFGTWGFLPDIDGDRELAMLRLNIEGLYRLTRLFLPEMIAQRRGHIINIASIAAFQPNPYMAAYGATKAFVRSFSLALYWEMRDQQLPIHVTTVCPPAARTPFREASGMAESALFSGWLAVDAPLVADATFRGYRRKAYQVIPGRLYRFLYVLTRLLPERLSILIGLDTLRKGIPRPRG